MSDLLINAVSTSLGSEANQPKLIAVNPPDDAKNKVAPIIQKYIRGYLARKPYLPLHLYKHYKIECDRVYGSESQSIPKAKGGQTKVYLPIKMPQLVLKHSGQKNARSRFHQMQEVSSILKSQNSKCLIIPKANLCGDFLVEQRLPINVDSYHNMGLYLSDPSAFNDAVRELTRLFSRLYLSDLVSYQLMPLGHIHGVGDFVRYDNLPLYLVEEDGKKVGKIGLIDLEHIEKGPNPRGLETLVRIFPLHLSIIKEEARLIEMTVNDDLLQPFAEMGKKYLQVGYTDFLTWLKETDKTDETFSKPSQHFEVGLERTKELNILLKDELLKLNKGTNDFFKEMCYVGDPQKDFLVEDQEEIAMKLAEEITPLLLNAIKAALEEHEAIELSKLKVDEITESQFISLRSPMIKREKIYKKVIELLLKSEKAKFKNALAYEVSEIAEQLTYIIMTELAKSGEIFSFDPMYYAEAHKLCWIRY